MKTKHKILFAKIVFFLISIFKKKKSIKIKKIDFIKLDVDGHELDVLKSGYNLLKEKKVPIIFEVAPYLYKEYGYTHYDLINLFKELSYRFYDIYNSKKIVDIDKFILSIPDGNSTTLIAK